jgi:CubicO group peptidase (beta-lactamase class C family)
VDTYYIPVDTGRQRLILDEFLAETRTTAFMVIQDDSILFEKYYRGYADSSISNIFSASKSVTSLLVGIAVDEGYISSVDDPITKYLPELKEKEGYWDQLTIRHLLNMRSGIKFEESYSSPFAEVARLYYGRSQFKQISKMDFEYAPGEAHNYQSVSTSLLSMAVERTTGKELGVYLKEKVWDPVGMEFDASWSLDDKKHRSTKSFCCLNTTARDLAKIGRLYINKGNWQGKQIVSEDWVNASTTPNLDNDCYQYQWYNPRRRAIQRQGGGYFTDSLSAESRAREVGLKHYDIIPDPRTTAVAGLSTTASRVFMRWEYWGNISM